MTATGPLPAVGDEWESRTQSGYRIRVASVPRAVVDYGDVLDCTVVKHRKASRIGRMVKVAIARFNSEFRLVHRGT